jgi:lysophospholipase L1-like esterase
MTRRLLVNLPVALLSAVLAFVAAEIGVRLLSRGGTLTELRNYVADQGLWIGRWRVMRPDADLGYVPRAGYSGDDQGFRQSFGADGLRLHNQRRPPPTDFAAPILVVGDSFAMGAEVDDDSTWPAYLQTALDRRVLNAAVSGYGIDQAVLRAEALAPTYKPAILLVGMIADDVERARMRILWGLPKPYFELDGGTLALRNVPLAEPEREPRLDPLRRVLGYSYLMDVVMRRLGLMAHWRRGQPSHVEPAHDHGDKVACLLMDRLALLRARHQIKVVLVAQYSIQTWQAEHFRREEVAVVRALADCARARGIDTIDTYDAVAAAVRAHGVAGSYTGIHMNPAGNRLTAELIADRLRAHP